MTVDAPEGRTPSETTSETAALTGKNILIVEDEAYVAMDLAALLFDAGAVPAQAKTSGDALGMIEASQFDAAILDIHLRHDSTYKVADALREKGTPFVFLTGYLTVREGYADVPFLTKPYTSESVQAGLEALLRAA